MWVRDEIIRAGVPPTAEVHDAAEVLRELERRFALPGPGRIWERLRSRASIQDPDGWTRIGALVDGRSILLVTDAQGTCGFRFQTGRDLQAAIDETSNFELYVTNDEMSYLLVFNHHDFLIGAGEAERWIETFVHDDR